MHCERSRRAVEKAVQASERRFTMNARPSRADRRCIEKNDSTAPIPNQFFRNRGTKLAEQERILLEPRQAVVKWRAIDSERRPTLLERRIVLLERRIGLVERRNMLLERRSML